MQQVLPALVLVLATHAGALLALSTARAGETSQVAPLLSETSPRFGADIQAFLTSRGTALGFDLECPYSELQFIRIPAGYGAQVRVTVVFRRGSKDQAGGDVWEERVAVRDFPTTREAGHRLRFHRDFVLEPGEYRVEVTLEDLNGGRTSSARGDIKVAAFGVGALGLGDLQFGFCRSDSAFLSVPSRRYEADLAAMCVRGTVYDRRADTPGRTGNLYWTIRNEVGTVQSKGDTVVALGPESRFVLRPRINELFLGTYALEVEVVDGERKWKTERTFEIETLTLPRGQNYATVIEILSYIATDADDQMLRSAQTEDDRQRAWEAFWQRRDPTPDTPRNEAMLDFFRRVRYANQNFAGQTTAGWRTDQGRIYIKYGAPDQIEERSATFYDPPLLIWSYFSLRRQFVFADREGFGRYELVSPSDER
ncbi:MAG: GWxTD domain-containing protein [Candidatus Eiseniibacteriota bacterium]